jgi:hypothetical protein
MTTELKIQNDSWARGEWDSEPDKINWVDETTNLDCMIVRNTMGALCGYVGVPTNHPLFRVIHDEVNADVHGGLTYSNECSGHICHVPEAGRPDDVWWFGFDCAHHQDVIPALPFTMQFGSYRNVAFVQNQVARLASQIAEYVHVKT